MPSVQWKQFSVVSFGGKLENMTFCQFHQAVFKQVE